MALNIKDPRTDRLARDLAAATGESLTVAIQVALQERYDKVQAVERVDDVVAAIDVISSRVAALPLLDRRSAEEILGYDGDGLPT